MMHLHPLGSPNSLLAISLFLSDASLPSSPPTPAVPAPAPPNAEPPPPLAGDSARAVCAPGAGDKERVGGAGLAEVPSGALWAEADMSEAPAVVIPVAAAILASSSLIFSSLAALSWWNVVTDCSIIYTRADFNPCGD